jgi:hypothetical protein
MFFKLEILKMTTQMQKSETSSANTRRDFMKKYGKLAAVTPVALTALISPATSAAPKSCRGNGNKSC